MQSHGVLWLILVSSLGLAAGCSPTHHVYLDAGGGDAGGGGAGGAVNVAPGDGGTASDGGTHDGGQPGATADGCGNPSSGPTAVTGSISDGTTWDAAHSPYVLAAGDTLEIPSGATLTIDKCAKVVLGAGAAIHVDGHLLTAGTSQAYVVITGDGGGRWNDISVTAPGWLGFNYTTIDGGGLPSASGGAGATIVADGGSVGDPNTAPVLGFMNLTITDSGSVGIRLEKNAYFVSGSGNLTVAGTGADVSPGTDTPQAVPLAVAADSLADLPGPMGLSGKVPEVWVSGGTIGSFVTLYDTGVPYVFHGSVTVDNTVDVRAGVTLAFAPHASLTVDTQAQPQGVLAAGGTATKPVVLTSAAATPAAGDWVGVIFQGANASPLTGSQLQHVTIEYAGGSNGQSGQACEPAGDDENAALGFFGTVPTAGELTGVTVAHSGGNGIVEGWTGPSVDLKTGNTFTDLAECDAVAPRSASGCGANPSCL